MARDAARDVAEVRLPYKADLEAAFDASLDDVTVLAGDGVAAWLSESGADAAASGDVDLAAATGRPVARPSPTKSCTCLQARNGASSSAAPGADVVPANAVAEQEADERAAAPAPRELCEVLPAGAVALRRSIPVTTSPGD